MVSQQSAGTINVTLEIFFENNEGSEIMITYRSAAALSPCFFLIHLSQDPSAVGRAAFDE